MRKSLGYLLCPLVLLVPFETMAGTLYKKTDLLKNDQYQLDFVSNYKYSEAQATLNDAGQAITSDERYISRRGEFDFAFGLSSDITIHMDLGYEFSNQYRQEFSQDGNSTTLSGKTAGFEDLGLGFSIGLIQHPVYRMVGRIDTILPTAEQGEKTVGTGRLDGVFSLAWSAKVTRDGDTLELFSKAYVTGSTVDQKIRRNPGDTYSFGINYFAKLGYNWVLSPSLGFDYTSKGKYGSEINYYGYFGGSAGLQLLYRIARHSHLFLDGVYRLEDGKGLESPPVNTTTKYDKWNGGVARLGYLLNF